jgi:hypothetical protein
MNDIAKRQAPPGAILAAITSPGSGEDAPVRHSQTNKPLPGVFVLAQSESSAPPEAADILAQPSSAGRAFSLQIAPVIAAETLGFSALGAEALRLLHRFEAAPSAELLSRLRESVNALGARLTGTLRF